MALATDVEIYGDDGVWRILSVVLAFRNKGKKRMRCVACKGHITLQDAAKDGSKDAYAKHVARWEGCPRSDEWDRGATRPHPNRVPD